MTKEEVEEKTTAPTCLGLNGGSGCEQTFLPHRTLWLPQYSASPSDENLSPSYHTLQELPGRALEPGQSRVSEWEGHLALGPFGRVLHTPSTNTILQGSLAEIPQINRPE